VHHEVMAAGRGEDGVQLRLAAWVAGPAAEQEAELQRADTWLAGQRQRLRGPGGVRRLGGDPQRARIRSSAAAASSTRSFKEKAMSGSGTP